MKIFVKKIMRQMRSNVITGVLLIIPSVTTIYVFIKLFGLVDSILPNIFHSILPFMPPKWTPGVGVLVSLILAYFVGIAAKNYLGKKVIDTSNSIIASMPILNKIYGALQQVVDSFSLHKKNLFEKVVMVHFPIEGSYCIGFITSEKQGEWAHKVSTDLVSVFVPTTPNPTSGFLLYLPKSKIIDLDISVETAIKAIMSAGYLSNSNAQKAPSTMTPIKLKDLKWSSLFKRAQDDDNSDEPGDGQVKE